MTPPERVSSVFAAAGAPGHGIVTRDTVLAYAVTLLCSIQAGDFLLPRVPLPEVPEGLQPVLEAAMPFYEQMKSEKI